MASTTIKSIKSNIQSGTLTINSPFALKSWGHATYTKIGSLMIVNITACYATSAVSSESSLCTLPKTIQGYQGTRITTGSGSNALVFANDNTNYVALSNANANDEMYIQLIVSVYG